MKTLNTIALTLAFIVGGACAAATPPVVVKTPTTAEVAKEAANLLVAIQDTKKAWTEAEKELQVQLDKKADCAVSLEGVTNAAAATVGAVEAALAVSPDLYVASIATVTATHNAWIQAAAGVEQVHVPAWTAAVHLRAAAGAKAATAAAIGQQIRSEQRIERLTNPSWADQLAWWWSR